VSGILIIYLFNILLNKLGYFTIRNNSFADSILFAIKLIKINFF